VSAEGGPSEAELRAYEEELSRITSSQLLLQASASLLNVGGRRLGLAEGSEAERDLDQVCDAVDAVKALLPILERRMPPQQTRPLRDALSQLQMAYARVAQSSAGGETPGAAASAAAAQEPATAQEAAAREPAAAQGGEPSERTGGPPPGGPPPGGQPPRNGEAPSRDPGPAERSGRLWIPGR
jgi:hypothetical protein